MRGSPYSSVVVALLATLAGTQAKGELQFRPSPGNSYGLIYDSDLNITWTQWGELNPNRYYYGPALNLVANQNAYAYYGILGGWRMPAAQEMRSLYNRLPSTGPNKTGIQFFGTGTNDFFALHSYYWAYPPPSETQAYIFRFDTGTYELWIFNMVPFYVWLVHDGDVAPKEGVDGTCGSANGGAFETIPEANLCLTGTASQVAGTGPWTWSCSGESGGTDATCSADIATFDFSVTVTGQGTGSVTSIPTGISCVKGTCTAKFPYGTTVSLVPSASNGSHFDQWGGACSGAGSCSVPISGIKSVTAAFDVTPNLKIEGFDDCYGVAQTAYDAALPEATILAKGTTLAGDLYLDAAKKVRIEGGYDSDFSSRSGYTTLQGAVKIQQGRLVLDRIKIR